MDDPFSTAERSDELKTSNVGGQEYNIARPDPSLTPLRPLLGPLLAPRIHDLDKLLAVERGTWRGRHVEGGDIRAERALRLASRPAY
jgi:hypothetical protein